MNWHVYFLKNDWKIFLSEEIPFILLVVSSSLGPFRTLSIWYYVGQRRLGKFWCFCTKVEGFDDWINIGKISTAKRCIVIYISDGSCNFELDMLYIFILTQMKRKHEIHEQKFLGLLTSLSKFIELELFKKSTVHSYYYSKTDDHPYGNSWCQQIFCFNSNENPFIIIKCSFTFRTFNIW